LKNNDLTAPIAVVGATGNQGGQVARALLRAGHPVRALTRTPAGPRAAALAQLGATVVAAQLENRASLEAAFDGAAGVFSVQNFWEVGRREEVRLGGAVLDAARAAGGPHVVYSGGFGAERARGVAAIDGKAEVAVALARSGLPFTILRPALFMDDLLGASLPFAPWLNRRLERYRRQVGHLFLAVLAAAFPPAARVPLTCLEDVGRTAAWAFAHPALSYGAQGDLVGSRETVADVERAFSSASGDRARHWPGMALGLRVAHPEMAALVAFLARHPEGGTAAPPMALQTLSEWLAAGRFPTGS
jgi:uncharacterized protein YbjT (DUF2867 family)